MKYLLLSTPSSRFNNMYELIWHRGFAICVFFCPKVILAYSSLDPHVSNNTTTVQPVTNVVQLTNSLDSDVIQSFDEVAYGEGVAVIVVLSALVLLTILFTLCSLLMKAFAHQHDESGQHQHQTSTLLFTESDSFLAARSADIFMD